MTEFRKTTKKVFDGLVGAIIEENADTICNKFQKNSYASKFGSTNGNKNTLDSRVKL